MVQNEIRDETRQMPFADREREFWMVAVCLIEERSGDPDGRLARQSRPRSSGPWLRISI